MGIRGPEPTERVPDELRLLTLGDSTVYGINVGDGAECPPRGNGDPSGQRRSS